MKPSKRLLTVLALTLACAARPAFAEWIVAQVSQPAHYAVDGRTWRPLSLGMQVPDGAWIHTGRSGRLLLRLSDETVQFKPNTIAAVSGSRRDGRYILTILHKLGTILIDADPGAHRTRAVETPYLAAVVKGTRFEVRVDRRSARVRVAEGTVTATHPTLGLAADVGAGQTAIAHGNRRFVVDGGSGSPRLTRVAPRAAVVGGALSSRRASGWSAGQDREDRREEVERVLREAISERSEQQPAQQ